MKKPAIYFLVFVFATMFLAVNIDAVEAAPRLTLTPVTGTYSTGNTFTVAVGVNSDTVKSSAVDVVANFDASKLEVVSIVKSANPPYAFDMTPRIDNINGKFDFSCASEDMSTFGEKVIVGELAVVTFKAKAVGTANLNFVCAQGITVDSNIFDSMPDDVISCSNNNVGSYVITMGAVSTVTPTQAPNLTATPTIFSSSSTNTSLPTNTPAAGTSELLKTGSVGSTIGLFIFGAISLVSAMFLKFL